VNRFGTSLDSASGSGRAISLYGRNSASGTYGYFKEHTLEKGDFKSTVKEQPGIQRGGAGCFRRHVRQSATPASVTPLPACARSPLGTADGKYAEAT